MMSARFQSCMTLLLRHVLVTQNPASIIQAQMNPTGTIVLAGEGLCRTYRLGSTLVPALRGVDVEIQRGDFLVLQGPSGSGKSTLINLLGLLDCADAGRVLLDGQGVSAMSEEALADLRRDRIGFIFQNFNLIPVLTAAGVLDLMRALNERNKTAFVIATHDPHVVARARRALTLQDGRIVEGP